MFIERNKRQIYVAPAEVGSCRIQQLICDVLASHAVGEHIRLRNRGKPTATSSLDRKWILFSNGKIQVTRGLVIQELETHNSNGFYQVSIICVLYSCASISLGLFINLVFRCELLVSVRQVAFRSSLEQSIQTHVPGNIPLFHILPPNIVQRIFACGRLRLGLLSTPRFHFFLFHTLLLDSCVD